MKKLDINDKMKKIEELGEHLARAEEAAQLLQGIVPSVIEPEPAREPVEVVNEVMSATDTTPHELI